MNYFDRFLNEKQAKAQTESTSQRALKTIAYYAQKDQNKAGELYDFYMKSRTDPTSKYYSGTYSQPTSTAVKNLTALGFDTSVFSDDYFGSDDYKNFINTYLEHSDTTGNIKSPTKKSTWQNQVAYFLNNAEKDFRQTQNILSQVESAKKAAQLWTGSGKNYSDDEIIAKVKASYPELDAIMDNSGSVALTSPVDYSEDVLRGAIWAGRNGGGTGDSILDTGNYYLGTGNQWQYDPVIADKRNESSPNYSIYSLGSTMEDECQYFDRLSFDQKWVDDNYQKILASGDEKAIGYLQNIAKAVDHTETLKQEKKDLYELADDLLSKHWTPKQIMEEITDGESSADFKDLFELDDTVKRPYWYKGKLVQTSEAFDYSLAEVEKYINDQYETKKVDTSTVGYTEDVVGNLAGDNLPKTEPEKVEVKPEMGVTSTWNVANPTDLPPVEETAGKKQDTTNQSATNQPAPAMPEQAMQSAGTNQPLQIKQPEQANRSEPTPGPAPANTVVNTPAPTDLARMKEENDIANLETSAPAILKNGTTEEKLVFDVGLSTMFDEAVEKIKNAIVDMKTNAASVRQQTEQNAVKNWFPTLDIIDDYKATRDAYRADAVKLEEVNQKIKELQIKAGMGGAVSSEAYAKIAELKANYSPEEWDEIVSNLKSSDPEERSIGYSSLAYISGQGVVVPDIVDGELQGIPDYVQDLANAAISSTIEAMLTNDEAIYLRQYMEESDSLSKKVDEERAALSSKRDAYDEAVKQKRIYENNYAYSATMLAMVGEKLDSSLLSDIETGRKAIQSWVPTNYGDNPWIGTVKTGQYTSQDLAKYASADIETKAGEIEAIENYLKRAGEFGIELSDRDKQYAQQAIAQYKRDIYDAGVFLSLDMPGFKEAAEKAMETGATDGMSELTKRNIAFMKNGYNEGMYDENFITATIDRMFGKYTHADDPFFKQFFEEPGGYTDLDNDQQEGLLRQFGEDISPEEKLLYFGILATEGEDAANKYFMHLSNPEYGAWQKRGMEKSSEETQAALENGNKLTALVAYGASFITNVIGNIQSFMTEVKHKIEGKNDNPYGVGHIGTQLTQDVRSGALSYVKNKVTEKFGEGYDGVVDLLFNAGTSAFDSAISSAISGQYLDLIADCVPFIGKMYTALEKAGEAGGIGGFAAKATTDWVNALYMAIGAGAQAKREAEINNATPEQQDAIFRATVFAESITEAITVGNIKGMFERGGGETAKKFFMELIKNGGEEAIGEGFNTWMENEFDKLIFGKDSQYYKMYSYYHDTLGIPQSAAEDMAGREMTKSILIAAASGFLSSQVSGPVAAYAGAGGAKGLVNKGLFNISVRNMQAKDANLLTSAAKSDNKTNISMTLSAILRGGGIDKDTSKASAQHIVGEIANGSTPAAVSLFKGLLSTAGHESVGMKSAISYASLTDGVANRTLRDIMQKVQNGEQVTTQDVDNLMESVNVDKTGENANKLQDKLNAVIRDNKLANKAKDILASQATADAIHTEEKKVENAQQNKKQADNNLEDARTKVEAVANNMGEAVDSWSGGEENPVDTEMGGPAEQTVNELNGADALAQQREDEAKKAEQKVEEAKEEKERVEKAKVNEARQGAETATAQEEQQQAEETAAAEEQAYNESVKKNPPVAPFGKSIEIKVNDNDDSTVRVTGLYDITDEGYVFTTEDGGLVHIKRDLSNDNLPIWDAINDFEDHDRTPKAKPTAYLNKSINARSKGKNVTIIGLAGVENNNGILDPVFVGSDGKTYRESDVRLSMDDIDAVYDLMDETELPTVESQKSDIQSLGAKGQETEDDFDVDVYDRTQKRKEQNAIKRLEKIFRDNGSTTPELDARNFWRSTQNKKTSQIDTTKPASVGEGKNIVRKVANRLGLKVEYADMADGKKGSYANGVITLNSKLTTGEAIMQIAMHEITHALEQTGTYQKYSQLVQEMLFGDDEAKRAEAIADKIATYKKGGETIDEDGALREIVADFAKDNLSDIKTIKRLVASGLGAKFQQILQKINEFIHGNNMQNDPQAQKYAQAEELLKQAMKERRAAARSQYTQEDMQTVDQAVQYAIDNPKRNFNFSSVIESRKDGLIAVHNVTERSLLSDLRMAGFPMASIAVLAKDSVWQEYGPISIFFGKDAVDPDTGKRMYAGDAYTPTLGSNYFDTAQEAVDYLASQPERNYDQDGSPANTLRGHMTFKKVRSLDEARGIVHGQKEYSTRSSELNNKLYNDFKSAFEQQSKKTKGFGPNHYSRIINRGIFEAYEALETQNADGHMTDEEVMKFYEKSINDNLHKVGLWDKFDLSADPKLMNDILESTAFEAKDLHGFMMEAKTPEVLGFDRVKAVLLPSNTSGDVLQALLDAGVPAANIFYYDRNADSQIDFKNREVAARAIPETVAGVQFDIEEDYTGEYGDNGKYEEALRKAGFLQEKETTTPKKETPTTREAEKVKKANSPARIAKTLAKALGVGDYIGTGRSWNTKQNGVAFYDRHSDSAVVKNKDAGDYTKTIHELGHAIAKRFGLKPTAEMMANFKRIDPSFFTDRGYSAEELPGEAIAEFMWRYMEGEEQGRDFAGDEFYDAFEAMIRGTDEGKAIAEARKQLQQFINADTNAKIGSVIVNRSDKRNIPFRQRIREAIDAMTDFTSIAQDFDDAIGAKGVKGLRAIALWANTAGKQATSILMGSGLTDANGVVIGDSLADRFADVGFTAKGDNLDLLNRYMLALHSMDRDREGKPVFDSHITKEERQAFIDDVKNNHPEVARAEEAFQQFRKEFLQEFLVNTGRLSQEAFDLMNKMYPHYVPTFRVKSMSGVYGNRGSNKTFTIKRATGSTEDIYNPMDSFFGMVNTIVTQNAIDRMGKRFDQLYNENDGLGLFATRLPAQPNGKAITMNQIEELVKDQLDADTLDQLMQVLSQNMATRQSANDGNILTVVRDDGSTVDYQFDNMELFKLLSGFSNKMSNPVLSALGFFTRGMSALTTGNNPIFAARNFMRDFQNSVNYGSWANNYGWGVLKWLASAYNVWRESDDYKDYVALGGGGWTRVDPSRQASRDELYSGMFKGYNTSNIGRTAKWAGKKVWNAITLNRLNEVIEQASRFAEYKYGKHDLDTQEGRLEAYLAGQEATVDFNRSGNSDLAMRMKKLVPFFNASMQGVYRTGRMLTNAERDRAPARFAKTVINTAFLSALSAGLLKANMDDDDKKEFEMLSDDLKSKHFYLPNFAPDILGEAPLIRIPLAQDPLTYAIHGAVTNALWSGDTEDGMMIDLAAIADTILDNLNPLGNGTILEPLLAIGSNKSWFGSRIVPSHLERNKYAPDQYTEETPDVFVDASRWLHEITNGAVSLSPMKLQYLAEQYTGFVGQLAIPALSKNSNGEMGGINAAINAARKRFVSDPLTSNQVLGGFYDGADLINSVIEEANQNKPLNILRRGLTQAEAGQAYEDAKALNSIITTTKQEINKLYTDIDSINDNSSLSDHDKYLLTSEKRREIIELALDVNEKIGEYKGKYVTGSNMVERMLMEGSPSYKPTDIEKLPDTFANDSDKDYMVKAQEVYDLTKKSSALPHPDRELSITNKSKVKDDYTISDEDWPRYTDIYKDAYQKYLDTNKKARKWDTLNTEDKKQVLSNAHSAGNEAMRKQYAAEHPDIEENTTGKYGKGNIDLNNRKTVENDDGSLSTEISMSFYDEESGKEVLIPTVINGRIVSDDEAIDHYYATGEYLGKFDTPEEADQYAEMLHNRQDWYYHR